MHIATIAIIVILGLTAEGVLLFAFTNWRITRLQRILLIKKVVSRPGAIENIYRWAMIAPR
jgi:hypothetical protein